MTIGFKGFLYIYGIKQDIKVLDIRYMGISDNNCIVSYAYIIYMASLAE